MAENIQRREQRLAARDARRAAQRDATLQPIAVIQTKPKHWVTVVIGAGGTAIWFSLAGWSYTAATVGDMIFAAVILAIAFVIAMGAFLASEMYGGFGNKRRLAINLSVAAGLAAISVALFWWEYAHRPAPAATADEMKKVLENLEAKKPAPPASPPKSGAAGIYMDHVDGFSIQNSKIQGYEKGIDAKNSKNLKVIDTEIENKKP
jgi:hypothetical protein